MSDWTTRVAGLLGARDWLLEAGSDPDAATTPSEAWRDPSGSLTSLRIDGTDRYRVDLWGVPLASVDLASRRIRILPTADSFPPDTRLHQVVDQVVPRALAQRGPLVLHAGAVRRPEGAVLIVGPSGRGKSTLTGHLVRTGDALLSDDAVLVDDGDDPDRPLVQALYPSLRLRPDSASALFPGREGPSMADYADKRLLDAGLDAATDPVPLAAIAVLGPPSGSDAVTLRRLSTREVCMAILQNSFALDPTDREAGRRRLAQAGRVAAARPAWALSYPRDYARLPEVAEALRWLAGQGGEG